MEEQKEIIYKKPMVSFLMNARIRTDLKSKTARDIIKFFHVVNCEIHEPDRDDFEFIIKCDDDDDKMKELVPQLEKYPFTIKLVFYRRWEGIYTEHLNYSHLLLHTNPNSKYIGFASDDAMMEHMSRGGNLIAFRDFIDKKIDYIYFTNRKRMMEPAFYNQFKSYRTFTCYDRLKNMAVEPYPIVSRKLLEITGGSGFCRDIDAWMGLLNTILITQYKIWILRMFPSQTFVRENNQTSDFIEEPIESNFNRNCERNPSYYTLVEQQAKNIYLNIKEDGVLDKYKLP